MTSIPIRPNRSRRPDEEDDVLNPIERGILTRDSLPLLGTGRRIEVIDPRYSKAHRVHSFKGLSPESRSSSDHIPLPQKRDSDYGKNSYEGGSKAHDIECNSFYVAISAPSSPFSRVSGSPGVAKFSSDSNSSPPGKPHKSGDDNASDLKLLSSPLKERSARIVCKSENMREKVSESISRSSARRGKSQSPIQQFLRQHASSSPLGKMARKVMHRRMALPTQSPGDMKPKPPRSRGRPRKNPVTKPKPLYIQSSPVETGRDKEGSPAKLSRKNTKNSYASHWTSNYWKKQRKAAAMEFQRERQGADEERTDVVKQAKAEEEENTKKLRKGAVGRSTDIRMAEDTEVAKQKATEERAFSVVQKQDGPSWDADIANTNVTAATSAAKPHVLTTNSKTIKEAVLIPDAEQQHIENVMSSIILLLHDVDAKVLLDRTRTLLYDTGRPIGTLLDKLPKDHRLRRARVFITEKILQKTLLNVGDMISSGDNGDPGNAKPQTIPEEGAASDLVVSTASEIVNTDEPKTSKRCSIKQSRWSAKSASLKRRPKLNLERIGHSQPKKKLISIEYNNMMFQKNRHRKLHEETMQKARQAYETESKLFGKRVRRMGCLSRLPNIVSDNYEKEVLNISRKDHLSQKESAPQLTLQNCIDVNTALHPFFNEQMLRKMSGLTDFGSSSRKKMVGKAYRIILLKIHPDKNPHVNASSAFSKLHGLYIQHTRKRKQH